MSSIILAEVRYFGQSKDDWDLLFKAVNCIAVLIGIPFTVRALRQSVRQKMNDSLTKLLQEYRSQELRDKIRNTIVVFPIFQGTYEERVSQFLRYGAKNLSKDDLVKAREVVHRLNDLAAYIEQGVVFDQDVYGNMYPRIIELSVRLEPMILAVTAYRGFRWGMRIRRIGKGAKDFHRSSRLHSGRSFVLDEKIVVSKGRLARRQRLAILWRMVIGRPAYTPSAKSILQDDVHAINAATEVVNNANANEMRLLSRVV